MPKLLSCGLLCSLVCVTCCPFAFAQQSTATPDMTLRGTLDAFEHPQQPQVSRPAGLSPSQSYATPTPFQAISANAASRADAVTPSKIVTHTIDLGSTIRRFAEQKKLPITQARLQALMFLGLAPQTAGGTSVATFRKIDADVFEITARQTYFASLPAMRQCLELGKKSVVVSVMTFAIDEAESASIQKYCEPNSVEVHSARLPTVEPVATSERGDAVDAAQSLDGPIEEFVRTSSITRENMPVTTGRLSAGNLNLLTEYLRKSPSAEILCRPVLSAIPGQAANVSIMEYRPFVVALKSIAGRDGQIAHEPIVQAIENGTTVRVMANPRGDRIHLMTDIAVSEITDVKTFTYPELAGGATIQIPRQSIRQVNLSSLVKEGQTLLIDPNLTTEPTLGTGDEQHSKAKRKLLVTLRAQIVDIDDEPRVALR